MQSVDFGVPSATSVLVLNLFIENSLGQHLVDKIRPIKIPGPILRACVLG